MTVEAQALLNALLKLPKEDRAKLAAELLASLDGPPDPDASAIWEAEIQKRLADLRSGDVKSVEWSDVQAQLERRLRTGRSAG